MVILWFFRFPVAAFHPTLSAADTARPRARRVHEHRQHARRPEGLPERCAAAGVLEWAECYLTCDKSTGEFASQIFTPQDSAAETAGGLREARRYA